MANISPARQDTGSSGVLIQWTPLTASDTALPAEVGGIAGLAAAVQVTGTVTDVDIEGSIDGTNWVILKDTQGNDATLTAAGIVELSTSVRYIRPVVNTGSVTVTARFARG